MYVTNHISSFFRSKVTYPSARKILFICLSSSFRIIETSKSYFKRFYNGHALFLNNKCSKILKIFHSITVSCSLIETSTKHAKRTLQQPKKQSDCHNIKLTCSQRQQRATGSFLKQELHRIVQLEKILSLRSKVSHWIERKYGLIEHKTFQKFKLHSSAQSLSFKFPLTFLFSVYR